MAVVGGGPAGVATALVLRQLRYSVVVIERSQYDIRRIGETLPPAIRRLLAGLGIWEDFLREGHSPVFRIRSAWGGTNLHENDSIFNPYSVGWTVDRAHLDGFFARQAEKNGATIYRDSRILACSEESLGNWLLEIDLVGRSKHLEARVVVDASGRGSSFARKQGSRRVIVDHLVGLVQFYSPAPPTLIRDGYTLIESLENGWWYSAVLPDGQVVAVFFSDPDIFSTETMEVESFWQDQLEHSKHTYARVRPFTREGPLLVRIGKYYDIG